MELSKGRKPVNADAPPGNAPQVRGEEFLGLAGLANLRQNLPQSVAPLTAQQLPQPAAQPAAQAASQSLLELPGTAHLRTYLPAQMRSVAQLLYVCACVGSFLQCCYLVPSCGEKSMKASLTCCQNTASLCGC